jgi:hypothetical protein
VDVEMNLKEEALQTFVNKYLKKFVPGVTCLLEIVDTVGGSVVLDTYYFTFNILREEK